MKCACGSYLVRISGGRVMCTNCDEIRDSDGRVVEVWLGKGMRMEGDYRAKGSWGWMPMGVLSVWNENKIK